MTFVLVRFDPGSVTVALQPLNIATKIDPFRKDARMAIEPWLVEAALSRLPQPLSPDQQRIVLAATRAPKKVRWPEWWSELSLSTFRSEVAQKSKNLAAERTGIPFAIGALLIRPGAIAAPVSHLADAGLKAVRQTTRRA